MPKPSTFVAVATLLIASVARSDGPAKPPSTEDAQVVHLKAVQWAPPKPNEFPPGAVGAVVSVDPQTGGTVGYAKFPAGAAIPTHWHSFAEYTILLNGTVTFTVDGKPVELAAGDFIVIPAKVRHSAKCGASECVLFTRRAGPTDYHFES